METIKNKLQEFALQIAAILVGLQLIVGSFMDLWLGGFVLGILYLTLKAK